MDKRYIVQPIKDWGRPFQVFDVARGLVVSKHSSEYRALLAARALNMNPGRDEDLVEEVR